MTLFNIKEICADSDQFERAVGGTYEKTPWVAREAFKQAPFDSISSMAEVMKNIVDSASEVRMFQFLRLPLR